MNRDLGIDLGTANTLVHMNGKGIVIREPSVVAVKSSDHRHILAVGEEAKEMIGRTPGDIVAIRPLKDGVIADFSVTEAMLRHFIRKAAPKSLWMPNPNVVICVPCGITEVEKRAVEEAAKSAGAREIFLMEEPMAAAIGAGLPIEEARGCMVVDIGGGTTEVAVISLGGVVASKSLRIGGDHLDETIMEYVRKEFNLMIGERTAEEIKICIGNVFEGEEECGMQVRGRDLMNGLPSTITITSSQIRKALREPAMSIVGAIRHTIERTPPELAGDIIESGITLTGGTSILRGLDKLIAYETGLTVYLAEYPLDCVALGASMALEQLLVRKRARRRTQAASF